MPAPLGYRTGPFQVGDHWIIIGIPLSGKTWMARKLVSSCDRVVYFDVRAEYEENGRPIRPEDLQASDLDGQYLRLTVQAFRNPYRNVPDEFIETTRIVREGAALYGPLVYVCDEIGAYATGAMTTLRQIHANGHKDGVVSLFISQRAVDLPLGCRATASKVMSLMQTHPTDLQRIEDEFGRPMREACERWRPGDEPATWVRPNLWS